MWRLGTRWGLEAGWVLAASADAPVRSLGEQIGCASPSSPQRPSPAVSPALSHSVKTGNKACPLLKGTPKLR